jgi:hypothetical protein
MPAAANQRMTPGAGIAPINEGFIRHVGGEWHGIDLRKA